KSYVKSAGIKTNSDSGCFFMIHIIDQFLSRKPWRDMTFPIMTGPWFSGKSSKKFIRKKTESKTYGHGMKLLMHNSFHPAPRFPKKEIWYGSETGETINGKPN